MKQFSIEMLPARQGDCLWIEYGEKPNLHRILIDGGTKGTFNDLKNKVKKLEPNKRHFELLVISHVDGDHIEGVLKLLNDEKLGITFGDIWFNGYRHLPGKYEHFGPVEGEAVSKTIDDKKLVWNEGFSKGYVGLYENSVRPKLLDGDLKLTILSPSTLRLAKLRVEWVKVCREAGIDPSAPPQEPKPPEPPAGFEVFGPPDVESLANAPFNPDVSEANGSSIAFLAEYDGKKALLTADAYADDLCDSIKKNVGESENKKLELDVFKVPHHGSKANINNELLKKLDCHRYLISTNGAYFQHPDQEAIARIIKFGGSSTQLIFNYKTAYNQVWDIDDLKVQYDYSISYPESTEKGKIVYV